MMRASMEQFMKILMYADNFNAGTQTFIKQDVEFLSQKHTLLFICTTMEEFKGAQNYEVKAIPFKDCFFQKKLWQYDIHLSFQNRHFRNQLNKIIDAFEPDLVHCQFGIEALRLIDNLEDQSLPITIQFRGYDASMLLSKKSYVKRLRQVLSKSNFYSIFVAGSLRENLKKHAINVERSMILHSGIDLTKFFRQNDTRHDRFTFLQVSSLNKKKGHEYTLEAYAKFLEKQTSKNFKLILTGDGPRKAQLIELTRKLGINEYVEFVGFVSSTKARELMQNADAFVHHSITPDNGNEEGIPNSIMEAMAMELPVISTLHAGIPELVTDSVNGYLVQEKDIDAYASRMTDITRWKKVKANRDAIADEFEIGKHIAKLEAFYEKMTGHSHYNTSGL